MPFQFHLDILDWIFKGILIGIVASAPMGPVGVLCIQRTLNKGRWYGLVTGIGATISDFIYALITGFGMSFIVDIINNNQNRFVFQILGSIMLMAFGIYCYRSDPTKKIHISGSKKGSLIHNCSGSKKGILIHNCVTAFLVTFSNPLIIFLFMAAFAQFAFVMPKHPLHMCVGYLSIICGALLWWFGLTWLIDKVRNKFDNSSIVIINKIIGSVVIIFSLLVLIGTVFNLYTFHY
ncbi:lysE family L-lysine exporter [Prevotella sp. CAG:255]|uniref:LysE family translocator n=1 Tax=Prevotella sp. CAG:255 TaxID=1262923 RepID=UPI00033834FE|nr:LysE family transporter [Prevotella sp. CAG:255]CCX69380.1 lysE family L-lysine exporter [Prevotella sp. CAG:255]